MTVCQVPGCDAHYGCRLRAKGLQVSPIVGAARDNRNWTPSVDTAPSHYRNILTEDRPGGFKMPILHADQSVIRHREAQANRRKIDDQLARTRATVAALSPKGR